MEAQEHRLTPLLLLLATIFFAGAPSSGAARGEAASSGLHPVVLLPGFTCSQFDARLTDEYEPPQASGCGARRQVRGWFRLWENYTALQADPALLPCYQDQLRLVYDPAAGNYRNDPGVETRVVSFGTTRSFRFDDPAQKDACMVRLVEALEGVGYREGASLFGAPLRLPLRAGGARRGVPLEADAPRGTRERETGRTTVPDEIDYFVYVGNIYGNDYGRTVFVPATYHRRDVVLSCSYDD
ncbi:lecithin-cholesterol acyltransferase-like 1 [Panicum miliaceum]|uniref:Lecithin-cholesterol acyltransferase-like 1 n=1 Tax=Panicum miliaceum TaxID=4540 RepID=A0A3L6PE80_PANMI|nr:lecithin-cholesterol acyltransferase-like 1 [Panicum miliaceum]